MDNINLLSNNDKIVESAYYIGNNKQWIIRGHIILNLKNVADSLSGQSFSMNEQRDLYQIVYDSFITKRMFSGEAYDDSDNYIEKVINIYFYGCSVIFHYLRNLQLMSNFIDKEVESLLPLSNQRYYSNSTYTDPDVISVQIKSIAD